MTVQTRGGGMKFVPDDGGTPANYVELSSMEGDRAYTGSLSIVAKQYEAPQRRWCVRDTAKVRKGEAGMAGLGIDWYYKHKRTDEFESTKGGLFVTPAEAPGVSAVVLTMDNGPGPFILENRSMDVTFSADGEYTDPLQVNEAHRIQSGELAAHRSSCHHRNEK